MKNCRKCHDRQTYFHYWYNFIELSKKIDRSTSCKTAGGNCRSLNEILNRYNNEKFNDGKFNSRTNISPKNRLKGIRNLLSGKFVEPNCSSRFYGPSRFNKNAWCPQTKSTNVKYVSIFAILHDYWHWWNRVNFCK